MKTILVSLDRLEAAAHAEAQRTQRQVDIEVDREESMAVVAIQGVRYVAPLPAVTR